MRKTWMAELILARFTTRSNASAIIGDLEEARVNKGAIWFWRSLFSVLLSCAWRPLGGYLLAAVGGGLLLGYLQTAFFTSMSLHEWTLSQRAWGSSVALLSGFTAFVALYSLVRFGPRDIVTKMATGYVLLGAVVSSVWWRNEVTLAALGIAVAVGMIALFTRVGRRGFGVLAIVTALHVLIWPITLTLSMTAGKYLLHSGTAIVALLIFAYFAGVGLVCAAYGWLHSQFLEDHNIHTKGSVFA
jgi:hypothetical protein